MDSRTSSILLNLDLNLDITNIASKYSEKTAAATKEKEYKTLSSTLKESYLTGCLKYGNNFVV